MRPFELFLIEFIFYLLLWIWNDYLASLVSVIFGTIVFFVLIISLIVEAIERSKVPRSYFWFMLVSILAPIVVAGIMFVVAGPPKWMIL